MKTKSVLFVFLLLGIIGCKKEGVYLKDIGSAPTALVSKEDLPEWINVDALLSPFAIYKGEWRNRTVYFVSEPLHSCAMCKVYYGNGEHIEFDNLRANLNDFNSTSKNWVLIYAYPEGFKMEFE